MKKNYFSIFGASYRKKVSLFILLMACCFLSSVLAQGIMLTPAPNPLPTRLAPTKFTVRVSNYSATTIPPGTLRLNAVPSTNFTVSPAFHLINVPLALDEFLDLEFTVTGNCNAPQIGGKIDYTLYDMSTPTPAVVRKANTLPIALTELDFIFYPPQETQADYASNIETYTRVWAISQSAPNGATPFVKVVNSITFLSGSTYVNDNTFANFEMTKVEVVEHAGGGTYTPLLDISAMYPGNIIAAAPKYSIILDENVFMLIGNNNKLFETGEVVYIRETFKIKACPVTNSTYSAEYGDGITWCHYRTFDMAVTSVVPLVYTMSSTVVAGSNKEPTVCGNNGGRGEFIIRYVNTSPDVLNRAVARNLYLNIAFAGSKYKLADAYFVSSAGADLGLPHLITTPIKTNQTINFNNFDYVTYDYSVLNLIDFDLDGKVNDLPQTKDFYIKYEYEVDFSTYNNDACFTTPNVFRDWFTTNMCYQNNCNSNLTGGSNTTTVTHGSTTLGFGPAQNQVVNPPSFAPGSTTNVTFFQNNNTNTTTGGNNGGWTATQNNEHYIVITLPKGFDYNNSINGLKISGSPITGTTPYISPTKITKTFIQDDDPVPGAGYTVLTVYYDAATLGNALHYSIDMTAFSWIPDADEYKFMTVEHQWGFPDNPLCPELYSYACVVFELNYEIVAGGGCIDFGGNVQRMTFGWNKLDKNVKITPANVASFGVDRDIVGPYDNVDVVGIISANCPMESNYGKDCLVEFEYRTMIPGKPAFFFPDANYAVELIWKRNPHEPHPGGLDRLELTKAQCVEKDMIVGYIPGLLPADPAIKDGNQLIAVNVGNWVFNPSNPNSPAMREGDTLYITMKLRTNENMPNVLSTVFMMRVKHYLRNTTPPNAVSGRIAFLKNFRMVDYARKSFVRDGFTYNENATTSVALSYGSVANPTTLVLNGSEYWVNEYRPNQFAENFVCDIEGVWNLSRFGTRERIIGEGVAGNLRTNRPLDPSEYDISYPAGNTHLEIPGRLETEFIDNFFFAWDCDVTSNCPSLSNRITTTADYTYYPTSEEPQEAKMTRGPVAFVNAFQKYAYVLSSANPTQYPNTNDVQWNFTVTNTSPWSTTDRLLPNCWLSIEFPLGRLDPSTFVLVDNAGNTWTNFAHYATTATTEKYWVKLGNLDLVATTRNFNLKCVYSYCTPFSSVLTFSMARGGYPVDPDIWFTGAGAPCPNKATLNIHNIPELSALRGTVISPPWNGPNGYTFCEPINYTAIFTNTQPSILTNPVLEIVLCQGLEFISASATHDGDPVDIIDIDDPGPETERTVKITFDPSILGYPHETLGDKLFVDFVLKPACYFINDYVPYVTFLAVNTCGEWVGETKHTDPIHIDGISFNSDYLIPDLTVQPLLNSTPTSNLDLSSATATANASVAFEADIILYSSSQSVGDYIAISIPPNMTINSVSGQTFTYWKTEGGNEFYKTPVRTGMSPLDVEELRLILTPTKPELWSCAPITFKLFTGVFIPLHCDGKDCGIEASHSNDKVKIVDVKKNAVSFQSASAIGSYGSATTENVTINGVLKLPANAHFDNIHIEVFSRITNTSIPGAFFDLNDITTGAGTPTLSFTTDTPLSIPAGDVCDLFLVIRKTDSHNQYICDSVAIRIPPPTYNFAGDYSTCVGDDLVVGENPITGYTYTWAPDTYIQGSPYTTPVTVNFPPTEAGTYTLGVEVRRTGGCTVSANVPIEIIAIAVPEFDFGNQIVYCYDETPAILPNLSNNGIQGTWSPAVIDMTPAKTTKYTFTPDSWLPYCAHPISIFVTVKYRITSSDILVNDEEVCLTDPVVFKAKTTKAFDVNFHWYTSPTATTPVFTGPNFPAGAFKTDTAFYVSASSNNICENFASDRKKVNLHVVICKLLGCDETLPTRYADEDYYLAGKYTHNGIGWDVPIVWHGGLDSIVYYVNGERLANPTLDGFEFPMCWSYVTVKAYFLTIEDECQFAVYIDRACPTSTFDDEGNEYKVTKLAGLCWTENLKATKYAVNLGEGEIEFAKPYYSTLYPDTQYHFDTFGLLYDWYSAVGGTAGNPVVQGICPEGWHIPSPAEWGRLNAFPAKDLKSKNYWLIAPGNDKYGFDARPAGWFNGVSNKFEDLYGYTNWWSTEGTANGNGGTAFSFNYFCDLLVKDTKSKTDALSVRCVLNEYDCE